MSSIEKRDDLPRCAGAVVKDESGNVLLVRAEMPDDVAYALVAALFSRQEQIAQSSPNALTIDMRAAIGTQPVPLHPGAENWFRSARNT